MRRSFLCGFDKFSEKTYDHRRDWNEARIRTLAGIFAIDVCAYAVLSNHYHVVLHIDKPKSLAWTDVEVSERWHQLFNGTALTQKYVKGEPLSRAEHLAVKMKLGQWRLQLCDISWFMRLINEPLARKANDEDQCTGKFWEARFKSQALCDEKALAACMVYVELNPVRAGIAETPEASEHTSIKKRIEAVQQGLEQPKVLAQFVGNPKNDMPPGLPYNLKDYLELVDWTGRIQRDDKKGSISDDLPPILERLEIEPESWIRMTRNFGSRFGSIVGGVDQLKRAARNLRYLRTPGLANCRAAFS